MDLEPLGDRYEERQAVLLALDPGAPPTLFGAADLTPEDFPAGTRFTAGQIEIPIAGFREIGLAA